MPCGHYQQLLLELGWSEDARRRAREALAHLDQCPACQAACKDFDALGAVLERPVAGDVEPPGGWAVFEQRAAAAADDRSLLQAPIRIHWWRSAGAAIAASVLVGLLSFGIARHIYSNQIADNRLTFTDPPAPPAAPLIKPFSPAERREQAIAFRNVSQVFDGRTAWMVNTNGSADIGLAPAAVDDRRLLLLRLAMVAADDKQALSTADIAIVPGQTANLTVPFRGGQSLHYQIGTTASQPTRLTLWAELQTPRGGGETLAALATNLEMDQDQKLSAGKLVTSAGAYELRLAFTQAAAPAASTLTPERVPGSGPGGGR